MATPATQYARGPVLALARCQECDWTHFSYGYGGPQKTRAAVRYHVFAKQHHVQVEIRRFRSYEPCPA